MATVEDTFRLMSNQEPVNTPKLTNEDNNIIHFNGVDGKPKGKITSDFMDAVKDTLVEARGGGKIAPRKRKPAAATKISPTPTTKGVKPFKAKEVPTDIDAYRNTLVNTGKLIIAAMIAIRFEQHTNPKIDSSVLNGVEHNMRSMMEHLKTFPEIRGILKRRVR